MTNTKSIIRKIERLWFRPRLAHYKKTSRTLMLWRCHSGNERSCYFLSGRWVKWMHCKHLTTLWKAVLIRRVEKKLVNSHQSNLIFLFPQYTIPLFVVYAAEYALQSGTWTAIGFPVDNKRARETFYEYSNWVVSAMETVLFSCFKLHFSISQYFISFAFTWIIWNHLVSNRRFHKPIIWNDVSGLVADIMAHAHTANLQPSLFYFDSINALLVRLEPFVCVLLCWITWWWCLC